MAVQGAQEATVVQGAQEATVELGALEAIADLGALEAMAGGLRGRSTTPPKKKKIHGAAYGVIRSPTGLSSGTGRLRS